MPTKFVINTAHKMGTSVEHAEKVWHDAKHAVKKGKRRGSWYWGKVINTFKRMMGVTEQVTFSEFADFLLEQDAEPVTVREVMAALTGWSRKIYVGQSYYLVKVEAPGSASSGYVIKFELHRYMDDKTHGIVLVIVDHTPEDMVKQVRWALLDSRGVHVMSSRFSADRAEALEASQDEQKLRDWVKSNLDSVIS